jgi:hypothetical protein
VSILDDPGVVVGDMADVGVTGPYTVVYLVFNTLFNLTGAGRQEDCFRNVARVLAPGGAFVIEAFVPDPADFDRDEQQVQVRSAGPHTLPRSDVYRSWEMTDP